MRTEVYAAKYRALAEWFLEHQNKMEWQEAHVEELADAIDTAIDEWFRSQDPRVHVEVK